MKSISPIDAATLAARIYDVQSSFLVDDFLELSYFKTSKNGRTGKALKAEVGGRVVLNHTDGFGVCAEGGDNNTNEVFVIFRGTTTANKRADWLTDARIGITSNTHGLPVHCGFDHCFRSMRKQIQDFFKGMAGKNISVVHCIGHSLGGAIASLAADWISRTYRHPIQLYTFGAPRVGTDWWVKSTTSQLGATNMHRVYHRTDPVPMVALYPFMQAPYNSVAHYLSSSQPLTSGAAHLMGSYRDTLEKKRGCTWDSINDAFEEPYTVEAAIESWLKSKSPVNANSASFWRWVDSALIYIFKKLAMAAIIGLQAVFILGFTIADKIAFILAKGIELADNISDWIAHLMRKLMQALGMKPVESKKALTQKLMRYVLVRITEKANKEARNAINKV